MKILRRYLLRQHAVTFFVALAALTSFELLRQVARRLEDLLGKGLPWTVILEFFALTLPFLIALTLSMSVLVAIVYTTSRLAGDREITAMRAGGVSLGQIVRPLLVAATGVAVVSFLFGDQILPRTNHRLQLLMQDIYRTKPTFALKEHIVNEVQKGRTALRAARIDPATYRMRDVTLYNFEDANRQQIVYADSGRLAFAPNQEDLRLTLYDGTIHGFDRTEPRTFQQTAFKRELVVVRGVGSEFVRREDTGFHTDRELGVCALDSVVRDARRTQRREEQVAHVAEMNGLRALVHLPLLQVDSVPAAGAPGLYCRVLATIGRWFRPKDLEAQAPQDTTTARLEAQFNRPAREAFRTGIAPRGGASEIRIARDRVRSARIRAANYSVELHKKFSIPAACIVFVLIGVPLGLRFPRGGLGLTLGAGMVIFAIYYIGLIGGESLANRLVIPPFVAMWLSNLVAAAVGIFALWRTHRSGCTARRSIPRRLRRRASGSAQAEAGA